MKDFFEENKIDWTTIKEYEGEGTLSSLCMALAESDKLLNYILNAQGYRGVTIFEKIHEAKARFSNLENLAKALEVKENIFELYDKEVSKDDIKRAVKYYQEAIVDLVEDKKYYLLIFSHDFAKSFFQNKNGMIYEDECWVNMGNLNWKWHLQQMVLEKEPLEYIKKFL